MLEIVQALALAGAAFSLGGCATVLNGVNQDVAFDSDRDGAVVQLSSGQTCTTPCADELRRGDDLRVDFNLEGYKPEYVYVQSRMGGSTFGNIIAGGGIGAVVDGSNGAANHLAPDPVYMRLISVGGEGEAVLLDKKGEVVMTVAEHNAKVGEEVRKGLEEQGVVAKGM